MFPLKDDIPSRHFPIVTLIIILVNTVVFLFELGLGPHLDELLRHWFCLWSRAGNCVPSYPSRATEREGGILMGKTVSSG
jgi:membrane associated rhomboid family serine protease